VDVLLATLPTLGSFREQLNQRVFNNSIEIIGTQPAKLNKHCSNVEQVGSSGILTTNLSDIITEYKLPLDQAIFAILIQWYLSPTLTL